MLAALAASVASCEALVGISEKELAPPPPGNDASGDVASDDGGSSAEGSADEIPSDGAKDGSSGDATEDSGGDGAGIADAGTDGDAGGVAPADGGGDSGDAARAGDGGDAAMPMDPDVPCAMQPQFLYCNDFDSVTTIGQTWDYAYNSYADAGAQLRLFTGEFVSPPQSVQTFAPPEGFVGNLQLSKDVGVLSTSCRVAFDVRMDVTSFVGTPQVAIVQMYIKRAIGQLQVNVVVNPGGGRQLQVYGVNDSGAPMNVALLAAPLMTWERVVVAYDSTGSVSALINGKLQGSVAAGAGAPGDTAVIMGNAFVSSGGTQPVTMEEDNIVVTGH